MATILLSAAGAALGAGFGGTVLGLSGAVIGRAAGAAFGRLIDQRIMGTGSEPVETGRMDRFQIMGAGYGAPIARCWGRVRLPGQVIWASPFTEITATSGGGKGAPRPTVTRYSYTVSLALALCEGEILGIGRIWADGDEIAPKKLHLSVYTGTEHQLPDPVLAAYLGLEDTPSYRGIAYVVIENLDLSSFGNRVPQLSFEVMRRGQGSEAETVPDLQDCIRGVALIPGTGEYALATQRISKTDEFGLSRPVNVNSPSDEPDLVTSLTQLRRELPNCSAVSLVVSWFGNDLRCTNCDIRPKVEAAAAESHKMPWRAGGIGRLEALEVPRREGQSIYGGTPADASVIQAIKAIHDGGQSVMFYPFVLMDQLAGNTLPNPYSDSEEQPIMPWRGRITLPVAPDRAGTIDGTYDAELAVAKFFGAAAASDFVAVGADVHYNGPEDWGFRRFILHYAHLCRLAGGVDAFCVGSELRGITQIRGVDHSFPAVAALIDLAAEVRSILGSETKISYAADWSEYFGYHRDGNVYFHLDPLWADHNIDFVGIDNYMPLSDWRHGTQNCDAVWGSVYNLDYLLSNVMGGEGYDWFYESNEARIAQQRSQIVDSEYGESWIFRFKDFSSWWSRQHFNRIDRRRNELPTEWIPRSKPIRFTEYGCAAVDNATNEPNKFIDKFSSESSLPFGSNGSRDDYIQIQYYSAIAQYWSDPKNNLLSDVYAGSMIDLAHSHAWAWDARPYPDFPKSTELWADGSNYSAGHWLNGRSTSVPLGRVVQEICQSSDVMNIDHSRLYGLTYGYIVSQTATARSQIQPLSITSFFDFFDQRGIATFKSRVVSSIANFSEDIVVLAEGNSDSLEFSRTPISEIGTIQRLTYYSADGDFSTAIADSTHSSGKSIGVSEVEVQIFLPLDHGKSVVETWLAEAEIGSEGLQCQLPFSSVDVQIGSIIESSKKYFRVNRLEWSETKSIYAVQMEPTFYKSQQNVHENTEWKPHSVAGDLAALWLDIPIIREADSPSAPYVAISGNPWKGSAAIWSSNQNSNYTLNTVVNQRSTVGFTLNELLPARSGLIDRGQALTVKVLGAGLSSVSEFLMLNGSNLLAIGNGDPDAWEIVQFQEASIVDEMTFDLRLRLRGQLGTDHSLHMVWPAGSRVILLDSSLEQIDHPAMARNLERHYRVSNQSSGDDLNEAPHYSLAFKGNGLRPLSVVHLRYQKDSLGNIEFFWKRRSRVDSDSWSGFEVPLAEETESYGVTIKSSSGLVFNVYTVNEPRFLYQCHMQLADNCPESFDVEVAQISTAYGFGCSNSLSVF